MSHFPTVAILCMNLSFAPVTAAEYTVVADHPRILVTRQGLVEIAKRCQGVMADDYAKLKAEADACVERGQIRWLENPYATPVDLMVCGLTYLIERELGRASEPYAEVIIRSWGDSQVLATGRECHFGYHALAFDWISDALSHEQRIQYGSALGAWLTFYTETPVIELKWGSWAYNKTWGPTHLNSLHSRDAITQKLFVALAITGAQTPYEGHAQQFLDSWATRIPWECIPAFDAMGGAWTEGSGHGGYGPISVIPYAFEAWRTATGLNWFALGAEHSFLKAQPTWLACLRMPHVERFAYLDDGGGSRFAGYHLAAPFVARALQDPLSQAFAEEAAATGAYGQRPWQRILGHDERVEARSPGELGLPTAHCFTGSGHVFMRSHWDDPNATWAFFGAGPHHEGHQHDDEGHFLIARKGGLISKGGGQGHNDDDHYWGGSLIFNIVTIFDPDEIFRRNQRNENDGGLLRHVYINEHVERGHLVAYQHNHDITYAAADLSAAYNASKLRSMTRQFLYLRGAPTSSDVFVVFDRVHSQRADFAKHFMLHIPEEPQIGGTAIDVVPGHVSEHRGDGLVSSWLSLPQDFGDKVAVLSTGRSRMFMHTLLPTGAVITKRGGRGHANWGHPLEPTAQYDHTAAQRDKPPICAWRLEVAAPLQEETCFLHVFQVDDDTVAMLPVVAVEGQDEVTIDIGNGAWTVQLAKCGVPGGAVRRMGDEDPIVLATKMPDPHDRSE